MRHTFICVHPEDADVIVGEVKTRDEFGGGEPYPVVSVGGLHIFPTIATLIALRAACDTAISDMRSAIAKRWSDEHPDQPAAVGIVGPCENCSAVDVELFARRVEFGVDSYTINTCGTCAGIDADALADMPVVAA